VDPRLLRLFQSEVDLQCIFVRMAADDLEDALKGHDVQATTSPGNQSVIVHEIDNDRVWYCIQALLVAAANVAKLLWPQPDRVTSADFPDRGKALRESLGGVGEFSQLHWNLRKLRNHLEHFDERLESWVMSEKTLPEYSGDRTIMQIPELLRGHYRSRSELRFFDSKYWIVSFRCAI